MQSYQIEEIKSFMGKLLTSSLFDSYLMKEATISTFQNFHIDGSINNEFYHGSELNEEEDLSLLTGYSTWKQIRPLCFDLIKGKRTPLGFKFILALPVQLAVMYLNSELNNESLLQQKTFLVNVRYDGTKLFCVTATTSSIFLPEKESDQVWDTYFSKFLTQNDISSTS